MTLTEHDTAEQVCNRPGCPTRISIKISETLPELIKSNLESGDDLLISGFGIFCTRDKNRRQGRSPATGANLLPKPLRVVILKCSGKLQNKVNVK